MTDELFLMAIYCKNSDYTHLLLKATITAKTHSVKARSVIPKIFNTYINYYRLR